MENEELMVNGILCPFSKLHQFGAIFYGNIPEINVHILWQLCRRILEINGHKYSHILCHKLE